MNEQPLLIPGQAVAVSDDFVGRVSGLFRLTDGLYFDLMVWAPGMSLGLNLEREDPREVPTGPEAHLTASTGGRVFSLPVDPGGPALDIVGGGTVGMDSFHYRLLVPVVGPLSDWLEVDLEVPDLRLHQTWRVSLAV